MIQHQILFPVDGEAVIAMIRIRGWLRSSHVLRDEGAPPHEVVGGSAEAKQPSHEPSTAVPQFAKQRDGFQPAECLFNELAFPMTRSITRVSGCARIDRASAVAELVLGDMWRDAHPADGGDPGARVIRLVRGNGDAPRR